MAEYSVWPTTDGPLASAGDSGEVNLGVEFYVTSACWFKAIRYFAPSSNYTSSTPRFVGLYQVADAGSGYFIASWAQTTPVVNGAWNRVDKPGDMIPLLPNIRYRAVVHHYGGGYSATADYFSTGAGAANIVNGPLVCTSAANSTGGNQGTYGYVSFLYYTQSSFNSANYWTDVVVSDIGPPISGTGSITVGKSALSGTGQVTSGEVVVPPKPRWTPDNFYFGSTPVDAIYAGSQLWWSRSSSSGGAGGAANLSTADLYLGTTYSGGALNVNPSNGQLVFRLAEPVLDPAATYTLEIDTVAAADMGAMSLRVRSALPGSSSTSYTNSNNWEFAADFDLHLNTATLKFTIGPGIDEWDSAMADGETMLYIAATNYLEITAIRYAAL